MSEIPHHNSVERAPGDRGAGLGLAERDRVRQTVAIYLRLFSERAELDEPAVRALGREALERIDRVAPELGEEIQGIAAGSGVDAELIGALNARTEVLAAGRGECSTVACLGNLTASGQPIGMQTWDWHDALADSWLRWTIDHADGRRVDTLTEAGIVGKIGVSNSGVGVFLNILGHAADGPPIGTPVHVLNRMVLDRADNASAALAILAGAQMSASSAVTVVAADEDGGCVCTVELSPAGPGFVTPDERGLLAHTNHFLASPGSQADVMVRSGPDSVLRLDHARRALAQVAEQPVTEESMLGVLRSHRGGSSAICCHPPDDAGFGDRWATLATIAIEPAQRRMRIRAGGPCGRLPAPAGGTTGSDPGVPVRA
jgi:isopenicillin-N N-acyltransferase like protein